MVIYFFGKISSRDVDDSLLSPISKWKVHQGARACDCPVTGIDAVRCSADLGEGYFGFIFHVLGCLGPGHWLALTSTVCYVYHSTAWCSLRRWGPSFSRHYKHTLSGSPWPKEFRTKSHTTHSVLKCDSGLPCSGPQKSINTGLSNLAWVLGRIWTMGLFVALHWGAAVGVQHWWWGQVATG